LHLDEAIYKEINATVIVNGTEVDTGNTEIVQAEPATETEIKLGIARYTF